MVVTYVAVVGFMYASFKAQAVFPPFLFGDPAAVTMVVVGAAAGAAGSGAMGLPEGFAVRPVGYAV